MMHWKYGTTGIKYKVGDTKEYGGKTFHYCDAPAHLKKIKSHAHSAESCRVRKFWLKSKDDDDSAIANVADAGKTTPPNTNDVDDNKTPSELTTLLDSAMNMVTDNDVVKNLINNAIDASSSI